MAFSRTIKGAKFLYKGIIFLPYKCKSKFFCAVRVIHEGTHYLLHHQRGVSIAHNPVAYAEDERQTALKAECALTKAHFPQRYARLINAKLKKEHRIGERVLNEFSGFSVTFQDDMIRTLLTCRAAHRGATAFRAFMHKNQPHPKIKK